MSLGNKNFYTKLNYPYWRRKCRLYS